MNSDNLDCCFEISCLYDFIDVSVTYPLGEMCYDIMSDRLYYHLWDSCKEKIEDETVFKL